MNKLRPFCLFLLLVATGLLPGFSVAQTIRYVSTTGTNANPATATSWATSTTNLQGAINSLTATGGEVWVRSGTYRPTTTTGPSSINFSFSMRNNVAIYGGFAGTETTLSQRALTFPSSTTLSGDIGTVGSITDNSLHVISNPSGLTTTAILDGFVITGGNAVGTFPNDVGGGMLNNGSGAGQVCSPLIRNCTFQGNTAVLGGAIFNNGNAGNASPVLTNCLFVSNKAVGGGAIFNDGSSSGRSSPVLVNCAFQGNTATVASPSTSRGGAIYTNASFGIGSPVLTNCSFQSNTATIGGAVYNSGLLGSIAPSLTNCVLFGNGGANTFVSDNGAITARYSLFDASVTGYTSGPGNLTATTSPFASTTSTLLRLGSPAINTADPATTTATVGTSDLAGLPRFVGTLDMGAFETFRFHVRAGATGTNNGLSWANAFTDLQNALTYAGGGNLTEIWVAAGTYRPTTGTSRTASFAMRPGVAIYGGFAGTETALSQRALTFPSATTLSGDIGTAGNAADNSFHVVNNPPGLTTAALLDGVVITGGNANGGSFPDNTGGGILNRGNGNVCSPTIRNCLFISNSGAFGGAMYNNGVLGSSSPVLTNCSFQGNTAATNGGAVYNDGLNGGSSSPVLTNCSFQSNTAATNGGAMFSNGDLSGSSNPVMANCVFWGNGGASTFRNFSGATLALRHSLVEPAVTNYTSGPGNLTTITSPFASPATTRLRLGSPAINTADPATTSATVGTTDLAGLPRFVGALDMGATEFQNEIVSVAVGNWNVPGTWNANRVPQVGDRVRLFHVVTLPGSYTGGYSQLRYDTGGQLRYGVGSGLRVEW
jgi:predicted outer membrane repeat protein